ncbi:hypothetical protein HMPREF0530_0107 [Lacticaseibacillus paracasei subsp. paracasei ATCC 25302 = DSM 5622 = JCM 8130]|nr:hypothetical protein HMPREF0530_0107 [Lacticaseibacillus paracasei subsp. paracasei ATCC 25302 = DSM 5622 = JCM 8130]
MVFISMKLVKAKGGHLMLKKKQFLLAKRKKPSTFGSPSLRHQR